jgi:hypothetical protein
MPQAARPRGSGSDQECAVGQYPGRYRRWIKVRGPRPDALDDEVDDHHRRDRRDQRRRWNCRDNAVRGLCGDGGNGQSRTALLARRHRGRLGSRLVGRAAARHSHRRAAAHEQQPLRRADHQDQWREQDSDELGETARPHAARICILGAHPASCARRKRAAWSVLAGSMRTYCVLCRTCALGNTLDGAKAVVVNSVASPITARLGCQSSADRLCTASMRRLLSAITVFLFLASATAPALGACCQHARHPCCEEEEEEAGASGSTQSMQSPPCCARGTCISVVTAPAIETKAHPPVAILGTAAKLGRGHPPEPRRARSTTPATLVLQRALGPPLRLRI